MHQTSTSLSPPQMSLQLHPVHWSNFNIKVSCWFNKNVFPPWVQYGKGNKRATTSTGVFSSLLQKHHRSRVSYPPQHTTPHELIVFGSQRFLVPVTQELPSLCVSPEGTFSSSQLSFSLALSPLLASGRVCVSRTHSACQLLASSDTHQDYLIS